MVVSTDSAVRYMEGDNEQWIVIEDDDKADAARDEHNSTSKIARRFIGKAVSDGVPLTEDAFQERVAIIMEIVPKYVFRYRDVMEKWQLRFSDESFIQRIVLGDSEIDGGLSKIYDLARKKHEIGENILNAYKTSWQALHVTAGAFGRDEISMMMELAARPDVEIRNFVGGRELYEAYQTAALKDLDVAAALVVDTTAMATMLLLDVERLLSTDGIVRTSYGVRDQLKVWASTFERPGESMTVGVDGRRVAGSKMSAEVRAERHATFKEKERSVLESVKVEGTPEVVDVPPELRTKIEAVFGSNGIEAMVMAGKPGSVLWTDDYAVAAAARESFGTRLVWTELVLRHWKERGRIDAATYYGACAKLIGWRYLVVPVSPEVMLAAGDQCGWNPEAFPLSGCLDVLGGNSLDTRSAVALSLQVIPAMSQSLVLPEARATVLEAIVSRMRSRSDGGSVANLILGSLDRAFGLDVHGARQTRAAFEEGFRETEDRST